MKQYYTYINNTLYFDSFTQTQVDFIESNLTQCEIVQICESENDNTVYIQLNCNEFLERVINNFPYRKLEERQKEKIKEMLIFKHDLIINELLKENDIILKYNKKDNGIKIKKLKIEKL